MSRRFFAAVLAVCVLAGCSDEDPPVGPGSEFSLTVTVTRADGSPAAGVRVAGMPVLAGWTAPDEPPLEGSDGPWHPVRVGFDMAADGFAEATVIDVAGDEVRSLFASPTPAGFYVTEWDGRDDAGRPLPGGWYNVHLVLTWSGSAGRSIDNPVMLEVCDPDWYSFGATGPDGSLVIDDRRLAPALFAPEQITGMEFTTETLLRLENEYGDGQYVTFDAADAAVDVAAVWQPAYETFRFELQVVDTGGEPLAGVAVGSMPGLPEWAWPWDPNGTPTRSHLAIPYTLGEASPVRFHIQDVTGAVVRDFTVGLMSAGSHLVTWDGRDDAGETTRGGWYEVVLLTSRYGGDPYWDAVDSTGVVHIPFDPQQVSLGETDAAGRLVIADRRLVPAFWDVPTVTFRDETGTEVGQYDLTTTTWLSCQTDDAGFAWAVVEAVDGPQAVPVTVGPPGKPRDKALPGGVTEKGEGPGNPLPVGLLGGPYPNPFN